MLANQSIRTPMLPAAPPQKQAALLPLSLHAVAMSLDVKDAEYRALSAAG